MLTDEFAQCAKRSAVLPARAGIIFLLRVIAVRGETGMRIAAEDRIAAKILAGDGALENEAACVADQFAVQ